MNKFISNIKPSVWVAIDVAKARNDVLIELVDGKKRKFRMANKLKDYQEIIHYLKPFNTACVIGSEAAANCHRPCLSFAESWFYLAFSFFISSSKSTRGAT